MQLGVSVPASGDIGGSQQWVEEDPDPSHTVWATEATPLSGSRPHLCPQYSLCNEPLIELSNPGASGSVFYVTSDDEFIIKTVMHKEAEFLQKLLPGYYMVCAGGRGGTFQN